MATQLVTWTALPNGVSPDKKFLRLSAFVSPRLQLAAGETENLSHFPDFLHWPAVVQAMSFTVQVMGGSNIPAAVVNSKLDNALWQRLFTANTFVRSHTFQDYSSTPVQSYSVRNVLNVMRQNYQGLGVATPSRILQLGDFRGDRAKGGGIDPLQRVIAQSVVLSVSKLAIPGDGSPAGQELAAQYEKNINKYAGGSNGTLTYHPDFMQFMRFHYLPPPPSPTPPSPTPDTSKLLDFHQEIASFGSYPDMLRRLGLVVDLEIPLSALPTATASRAMQVIPQPVRPDFASLATNFMWDGTFFQATPESGDLRNGMLNLNSELYDVVQVDVDGAAFKTINYAVSFLNVFRDTVQPYDLEKDLGLPSLRSAGISVIRERRAAQLQSTFTRSKEYNDALNVMVQAATIGNTASPPTLSADALARGYRIDIWDSRTTKWHSLNQRVGDYRLLEQGSSGPETPYTVTHDEGFIQLGAAQAAPNTASPVPPDLHVHEALFGWRGWSLSAPHPGKSISDDGQAVTPDEGSDPQIPMRVHVTAEPHSLPTLRFGVNYQVRARVVDLAGNSLSLDEADALSPQPDLPTSTHAFEYLRYEPVAQPVVVLRTPLDSSKRPGETAQQLVIRSVNSDPSLDIQPTSQTAERHIVPPRTSQLMAETHGLFDDANGAPKLSDYALIVQKEKGTLATQTVPDGTNGTITVPIEPTAQLKLPYLPDPLARGAAFRNLPGPDAATRGELDAQGQLQYQQKPLTEMPSESVTMLDFGAPSLWPDMLPFRIVVVEGQAEPQWDKATRVLTVKLPKAEQMTVQLSSYLNKDDLRLMGVWRWIREGVNNLVQQYLTNPTLLELIEAKVAQMVQYALEGGHWMLTPPEQLVFTHAVKHPLGRPNIQSLVAVKRGIGQTTAELLGSVHIHGKSTSKIDMLATWSEPTDDPNVGDGTSYVNGKARAFESLITLPGQTRSGASNAVYDASADTLSFNAFSSPPKQEFGDTRYRRVSYQVVSTSRFPEYFPPVPDGLPPDDPNGITRSSAEVVVDVPNSARPAAPKVLYAVPTFGWTRQEETNLIVSQRIGGGLRVYLDHPWYSSGDGELLGVVFWQNSFGLAPEQVRPYVTHWGQDPLWGTTNTINSSPQFNLTNAVVTDSALTLDELATITVNTPLPITNPTVAVAGHEVKYDAERGLWYCDIEFNTSGTYMPFVRLGLTRYQPHSLLISNDTIDSGYGVLVSTLDERGQISIMQVDGNGQTRRYNGNRYNNLKTDACLSRVVLTDFAQLTPDRSLLITYDPYDANLLNVVVSGTTYTSSYVDTFTELFGPQDPKRRIEVMVEHRIAGIPDDALAWEPDSGSAVSPLQVQASGEILWSGQVTLPQGRQPKQYRLVIKEYELLYAGNRRIFTSPVSPVATNVAAENVATGRILLPDIEQRLVYADTVEI